MDPAIPTFSTSLLEPLIAMHIAPLIHHSTWKHSSWPTHFHWHPAEFFEKACGYLPGGGGRSLSLVMVPIPGPTRPSTMIFTEYLFRREGSGYYFDSCVMSLASLGLKVDTPESTRLDIRG